MALKEHRLIRPADKAEFTMLLDEDDVAKYTKAGWDVTPTPRKVAPGVDLGADTVAPAKAAAKAKAEDA